MGVNDLSRRSRAPRNTSHLALAVNLGLVLNSKQKQPGGQGKAGEEFVAGLHRQRVGESAAGGGGGLRVAAGLQARRLLIRSRQFFARS